MNKNLSYRAFKKSDAQALSKIANNETIALFLRDNFPYPYTLEDAKKFINNLGKHPAAQVWGVFLEQTLLGAVGIFRKNDVMKYSAEIGYWLGEEYWNQGICTQMLMECIPSIFLSTDLERIYAIVFQKNHASVKVLEKVGFTYEGNLRKAIHKNGEFQNASVWSILREEAKLD